ncbi:hypothetical protein Sjap_013872 [Stephania japonica]|uniref:Uncharacterized protein n=1 Tax=Stephania japonica TaxID=461633 RepID=A0AAP0P0E4_9MAGN
MNEKSRFCKLAVMQLEWCLKFVEETNNYYVVVESVYERERLVSDLTKTRDRVMRRLKETEFTILEKKDRLLIERFENEVKLWKALELRERKIMSLEDQFDVHGGLIRIDDEGRDGGFCELKNFVDEQFFNIKQKPKEERMNFSKGKGTFSGSELGFEKMGSDIDILKGTLDIAFRMMCNAISLFEVRLMEQQWRWAIERDTFYTVFNGFAKDVQDLFLKGEKNNCLVMIVDNHFQLIDDIANLFRELNQLIH